MKQRSAPRSNSEASGRAPPPTAANRVRIIGGLWRSRIIRFTPALDLRPTPDRVRETLFNWLGQDLTGNTCLDLFAGSGALGFEAASRGAARVVMVECEPRVFAALKLNAATLQAHTVELIQSDALEFLRADSGRYDVVFLDPPFRADFLPRVFPLLESRVAAGAMIYVETPKAMDPPPQWQIWRSGRAGAVHHQLLKRKEP